MTGTLKKFTDGHETKKLFVEPILQEQSIGSVLTDMVFILQMKENSRTKQLNVWLNW